VIIVLIVWLIWIISVYQKMWTLYNEVQTPIHRDSPLTVIVGHIMDTPWSWQFSSSTTVSSWWWWAVTYRSRCHHGGEGWLPPPTSWIVPEPPIWAVTFSGYGVAHEMWRLVLPFSPSFSFELYGLRSWAILLLAYAI
jgi:hypothetical protein